MTAAIAIAIVPHWMRRMLRLYRCIIPECRRRTSGLVCQECRAAIDAAAMDIRTAQAGAGPDAIFGVPR